MCDVDGIAGRDAESVPFAALHHRDGENLLSPEGRPLVLRNGRVVLGNGRRHLNVFASPARLVKDLIPAIKPLINEAIIELADDRESSCSEVIFILLLPESTKV